MYNNLIFSIGVVESNILNHLAKLKKIRNDLQNSCKFNNTIADHSQTVFKSALNFFKIEVADNYY